MGTILTTRMLEAPQCFVALALGIMLFSACHPSGTSPDRARWIEEDPAVTLSLPQITRYEETFRWTFEQPNDLEAWTARNLDLAFEIGPRGLELRSSGSDPYMIREVDLDARTLHAMRVTFESASSIDLQVYWAKADGGFSEKRKAVIRPSRGAEVLIDLGQHESWSGRIRQIRIDPTSTAGQLVRIREITGLRKQLDTEGLATVLDRAWKVEIGHELRNVLLAPPGRDLERRFRVPRGSSFRFAFGILRSVSPAKDTSPVHFRVRATGGGVAETTLFEDVLDPRTPRAAHWQEARVDLSAYSGRDVRLTLEASTKRPDLLAALPLWAHPEIVPRVKASERPQNVVLISIDTLRADHLSLYGYERRTSPRIDAWAAERGVTFENAVAQAPWTLPSHASLFTGLNPTRHGINHESASIAPEWRMLAEQLRDGGWSTGAVTGGGFVGPWYGFAQGFDVFHYWDTRLTEPHRELKQGLARARSFIQSRRDEPFFLFFHTYETHVPYRARAPFYEAWGEPPAAGVHIETTVVRENRGNGFIRRNALAWKRPGSARPERHLDPGEMKTAIAMYDSGIARADAAIGALLDHIDELGLRERTIIVLTSDHGEAFGEEGEFGHGSLGEDNLLVPLILSAPGKLPAGHRIPAQVRSIDVLPTLLDLLDLRGSDEMDGRSLVPLSHGKHADFPQAAFAYAPERNHGLAMRIGNDLKYVYNDAPWKPVAERELVYDLRIGPYASAALPSERIARLRDEARRELEKVPGLRLRISSSVGVEGSLRGRMLSHPSRFKAGLCDCFDFVARGKVELRLPPGNHVLAVNGPDPAPLTLALRETSGPANVSSKTIDPGAPLDWQPAPGIEIRAWWERLPGAGKERHEAPDPSVLEQLRALGYAQ